MKEPIKLGGEPWKEGSPSPKQSKSIQLGGEPWKASSPTTKQSKPIQLGAEPWKEVTPSHKQSKPIQLNSRPWDTTKKTNEKKDPVSVEKSQWGHLTKKEETEPIKINRGEWENPGSDHKARNKIKMNSSSWEELPENEQKSDAVRVSDPTIKFESGQWGEISGLQSPEVIRQFEGINTMDPFSIKDSHATSDLNITTSKYPAMTVRTPIKQVGESISNTGAPIYGLAVYKGNELHAICDGNWYAWSGENWIQKATAIGSTRKWSFINFQGSYTTGNLILANGESHVYRYDGSATTYITTAPANADYIATHDNRVYLAVKSTVYFSALRKAEDWTTVNEAGQVVVETGDGGDITGLIAGSSRLTVFKKNSIYELYGTNPTNFQLKIVTDSVGSPTGNSAQVIDGVIYFLGSDGVYEYSGGSLPSSDFSIQAKGIIATINKASAEQSVSWQNGRKYYLAIPTGTNTQPDTILEYDIDFKVWNIWKFPVSISAKGVVINGVSYIGGTDGKVYMLDSTDLTDNGIKIPWEWVSKPFGVDSLAAKARWYKVWVVADIPAGSTFKVSICTSEKDMDNWIPVQTIASTVNVQAKEITIPSTYLAKTNFIRIKLSGTGPATIHEISMQKRIFQMGL